jgi:hypothetical protein
LDDSKDITVSTTYSTFSYRDLTYSMALSVSLVRFRLCMSMEWMNECVDGLFITQLLKACLSTEMRLRSNGHAKKFLRLNNVRGVGP